MGPGGRGQVRYIDPLILGRWVGEVLHDTELAEAIREAASEEVVYARQIESVEPLLQQRLGQCRAVTEPEKAKEETASQDLTA
jgi:hypothetical protein